MSLFKRGDLVRVLPTYIDKMKHGWVGRIVDNSPTPGVDFSERGWRTGHNCNCLPGPSGWWIDERHLELADGGLDRRVKELLGETLQQKP